MMSIKEKQNTIRFSELHNLTFNSISQVVLCVSYLVANVFVILMMQGVEGIDYGKVLVYIEVSCANTCLVVALYLTMFYILFDKVNQAHSFLKHLT